MSGITWMPLSLSILSAWKVTGPCKAKVTAFFLADWHAFRERQMCEIEAETPRGELSRTNHWQKVSICEGKFYAKACGWPSAALYSLQGQSQRLPCIGSLEPGGEDSRRGKVCTLAASATTLQFSWCTFASVMTPLTEAGISTSHGRFNMESLSMGVPVQQWDSWVKVNDLTGSA